MNRPSRSSTIPAAPAFVAVLIAGALLPASAAIAATDEGFAGASADGTKVFFDTPDALVSSDTDGLIDVYERSGGVTRLVSVPGAGAAGLAKEASFENVSDDGSLVVFRTQERLVTADTDAEFDIYQRGGGVTSLISAAGAGATPPVEQASFVASSVDGTKVIFYTDENMVTADTDGLEDLYARSGGLTTLVSAPGAGASGPPAPVVSSEGARSVSDSAGTVIFNTDEKLVGTDGDSLTDVYKNAAGVTTMVSEPGTGAAAPAGFSEYLGMTPNGGKILFGTLERLVTADTDALFDVYERAVGFTSLISGAGAGATAPATHAFFAAVSADGNRIVFETEENLVAADTDGLNDVYVLFGGILTPVSVAGTGAVAPAGPSAFRGASADGTVVFFETGERLRGDDTDSAGDVYQRVGALTTLVSAAGAGATAPVDSAFFSGASTDGARVFFESEENLLGADSDGQSDVYERFGGATILASVPGMGAAPPATGAEFGGSSADGSRVFFDTEERLVAADTDALSDVYERSGGLTTLVSAAEPDPLPAVSTPPAASTGKRAAALKKCKKKKSAKARRNAVAAPRSCRPERPPARQRPESLSPSRAASTSPPIVSRS